MNKNEYITRLAEVEKAAEERAERDARLRDTWRSELGELRARLGIEQHEHRLALGSVRNQLAAANALLRQAPRALRTWNDHWQERVEAHLAGQTTTERTRTARRGLK